jgi:hypothetical protein
MVFRNIFNLWALNLIILILVFLVSLGVDGNGKVFGIPFIISTIIAVTLLLVGTLCCICLYVTTKNIRHKLVIVICLIFYFLMLAPAVFML